MRDIAYKFGIVPPNSGRLTPMLLSKSKRSNCFWCENRNMNRHKQNHMEKNRYSIILYVSQFLAGNNIEGKESKA